VEDRINFIKGVSRDIPNWILIAISTIKKTSLRRFIQYSFIYLKSKNDMFQIFLEPNGVHSRLKVLWKRAFPEFLIKGDQARILSKIQMYI